MNLHQAFAGRRLAIACLLAVFLVSFQAASADPEALLVRFEAMRDPSGIRVEWETATEFNTIGFRLYRSLEASPGDWGVALFSVAANGDAFTGWVYSYTDTAVVPGTTYYYMLGVIDEGGMVTLTGRPVGVVAGFGCGAVTEIPQTECEALVALYDSTNGPGWTGSTGWLSTNTPCTWRGVSCSSGHVTNIDLADNQLSGSIPPELGNLANLQSLYLSYNQLRGALPRSLMTLFPVTFYFHYTSVCEPPDPAFQAWLASIPALQRTGALCKLTHMPLVFRHISSTATFWASDFI